MSLVKPANAAINKGLGFASSPEDLSLFLEPDCAATIWDRPVSPALISWLNGLAPHELPQWREIVAVEAVHEAVLDACEEAGTPDCQERAELIADVQELADAFAGIMQAEFVQVRLDVIRSNACRRFHVDAVTGRLVCTYRGTGTQYAYGGGDSGDSDQEPRSIETVSSGAPILLRGTLWPDKGQSGLLHRSPPIEGTGETRLVLVLDPIFDQDPEAS